jgi:GntR family transcriptional regulator, transcriptional repressor for pyruvate dehydrogenase complex
MVRSIATLRADLRERKHAGWTVTRFRRSHALRSSRVRPVETSPAISAVFEPVTPPSTFEETVQRLGTAIRVGLLPPGTRLPPERELAERLGISRSTLRHALTTLVQSGLLASARGRSGGTFVSAEPPLARGDHVALGPQARSVLDHRVAIEAGSALLAAERRRDEDLAALRLLIERMSRSGEFEDYRRADIRFHIGLAEAARSPRLVAAMTEVQGQMSELIASIPHPAEVLTHSNAQHRRIVACLARRDAGSAVACLREHLEGTEHILEGLMPVATVGSRG